MQPYPFDVEKADDTGPDRPWALLWCETCGTVSTIKANTQHDTQCVACYLRKQSEGEINTIARHPKDTEDNFCDCYACRARRVRTVLNAPGLGVESPTLDPEELNDVEGYALSDDLIRDASEDVALMDESTRVTLLQNIPPWVPDHVLRAVSSKIADQLAAFAEQAEDEIDAEILYGLVARLNKRPVRALHDELTLEERRAISAVRSAVRTGPNRNREAELEETPIMDELDLQNLHWAALEAASRLLPIQGETYLAPRDDAELFVDDFASGAIRPFVALTTGNDTGVDYDIGSFLATLLGGATFDSFKRIVTMLYVAVHPDQFDAFEAPNEAPSTPDTSHDSSEEP